MLDPYHLSAKFRVILPLSSLIIQVYYIACVVNTLSYLHTHIVSTLMYFESDITVHAAYMNGDDVSS